MILVLDNYDSFTWNIVHALRALGAQVRLARNDQITVAEALSGADGVLIGPGPGVPENAGITMALVAACINRHRPLLGICLGHQAIGEHFGAKLVRTPPVHGKAMRITHDGTGLFAGLEPAFAAVRYNSLSITDVPSPLLVNASAEDGTVQGIRHRDLPVHGLQYHPESIASVHGAEQLSAFLNTAYGGSSGSLDTTRNVP